MATAVLPDPDERLDYGRLANNYMLVQGLQGALSRSETNIKSVPKQLELILDANAWREFFDTNRSVLVRNPADFRRFIEGPRPEGCQTPIHVLRHMVKGSPVESQVEELLRGAPGVPKDFVESRPRNDDGSFAPVHNRNDVTVMDSDSENPAIIPMPLSEKPKRKRDYSRESKQGNSVGYTLRRLEREAPELLDKVKSGDMSPNAAAIKAGFRDKVITVPDDPQKAARVLLRHFKDGRLAELIKALSSNKGRS